jgi:malonyl-CoA/methylmalonyl-CoA synthetase
MMPTALRVLRDGEDIPRTDSMKVLRRKAAEKYFALSPRLELPMEVEKCDVCY